MSAEVFNPLAHKWKIERLFVTGRHPTRIRKSCGACAISGGKSLLERVAPCPGVPHTADCVKNLGYIRVGDHGGNFECQCGANKGHEKKPFWKMNVCYFCDWPRETSRHTQCNVAPGGFHRWIWRKG